MRKIFSRRAVIALCVFALLLFFVRPRVGRLRGAVAQAISKGLGRQVDVSSIHLRLFPRLGFELDDLVVHDDPQFGREPLMRAPDVTAWLRFGSLLRGRIEIASLSLSEASLNLTRNDSGRWNVEDLIERTSRTSLAPTPNGPEQSRASFPYIDATRARINFKIGPEKTHFALTNADFALWQDSENTWSARVKAGPVRTDANLTDTGVINLSGTWRRSTTARQTPLQLSFQWKDAQIGQLSRLLYGTDKEWRGGVVIAGTLAGTPEQLQIVADGSVEDFRHRDVIGGGELRLATHCAGDLNLAGRNLSNLDCVAPSGSGFMELKGSASGPTSEYLPFSTYDFWLISSKVPAGSIFALARHANIHFGSDVIADGELDGSVEIGRENAYRPLRLQGSGALHDLKLSSSATGTEIAIGTVPLTLISSSALSPPTHLARNRRGATHPNSGIPVEEARLRIGPASVIVGGPTPLHASAVLSRNDYDASVQGQAGIGQLLRAARVLGIPAPSVSADGEASVDLTVAGKWSDSRPVVIGTAQLSSVQVQVSGMNAPLEISNAHLTFWPGLVRAQNLVAHTAGIVWRGSMEIPRPCADPAECVIGFNLYTASLSARSLNLLTNPALAKKPWYRVLTLGSTRPSYLLRARASGKVVIDDMVLGPTHCSAVSANLKLNAGEIQLSNVRARALEGNVTGTWSANLARKEPSFSGSGTFVLISLGQVSQLMNNKWIEGTGSAVYTFSAAGRSWQELIGSADVSAQFAVDDGIFPHITLVGATEALRANELSGKVRLQEGTLTFKDTKLITPTGAYGVNGTAGMNGLLSIRIGNETNGFNITGTLARTRVSSIPTAQAALKP